MLITKKKPRELLPGLFFVADVTDLALVAILATGGTTLFFVATFAGLVESVFCFRSSVVNTMTAVAVGLGKTCVVTGGAVAHDFLVSIVREGDIAHFCRQCDFRRTGGKNSGSADSQKREGQQGYENFLHFLYTSIVNFAPRMRSHELVTEFIPLSYEVFILHLASFDPMWGHVSIISIS